MPEFIVNILTSLLPVKSWRHMVRRHFLGELYTENRVEARNWRCILRKFKIAQNITAEYASSYYCKVYRKYDLLYYPEVLKWLYADAKSRSEKIKFLDIGAAYGVMSVFATKFLYADVYATDFTDRFHSPELARLFNIKWVQSNIETEPIPFDEKFDIIVFTEVLEHLNFNPVPTLVKIKNAMAKDGTLYLSTPNAKFWGRLNFYEKLSDIPNLNPNTLINGEHIWHYNVQELLYIADAAGLAVVDFDYGWSKDYVCSRRQFNLKLKRKEDISI